MDSATPGNAPANELSGARVIVTGGSRGIGAAFVAAFLERGAQVVVADLHPPETDHPAATFVKTDVSAEADTEGMVQEACQEMGGVDALVNNAGLYRDLGNKRPFDEITAQEFDDVMRVNVRGVWQCVKSVAPVMRRQRQGRIVNISSATVYMGSAGFAHYVASKSAVIGLTRSLARELGPYGVTVNSVAPGLVTDEATLALNDADYVQRIATGRSIQREMLPADLVGAVLFLASPSGGFVSGQSLVVDGGQVFN